MIKIIKFRRVKGAGTVARMGEKRNACRLLVGKPEGKRPPGEPRRWCVDNIEMDQRASGGKDCVGVFRNWNRWSAVVNTT
jgi:hypothetical protein